MEVSGAGRLHGPSGRPSRTPLRYYRTGPEIIPDAVMFYVRFPLASR